MKSNAFQALYSLEFFPLSFLLLDFSLLLEADSYSMAAASRQYSHNLSLDGLCVRDRSLVSLYSQWREVCIFSAEIWNT